MGSIDIMDDFRLNTGDAYADITIEQKLAQMPEYWALIEYLEKKGLLDRKEFWDLLNKKCAQHVVTANIISKEPQDD
jgi:predicted acetyltransferase